MEVIKDKKVSFIMILFSVLMLIFGIITKDYNGNYYQDEYETPPLKWYDVDLFGMSFDYVNFLLFFIITLGIGIYLLVYLNDQSIKSTVKKPKEFILKRIQNSDKRKINKPEFLNKLKNKYSEYESSNLPEKKIEKAEKSKEDKATSIVGMITIVAIIFTFFMATKVGFSLWFFIIYAYYQFLTLAPKSKK